MAVFVSRNESSDRLLGSCGASLHPLHPPIAPDGSPPPRFPSPGTRALAPAENLPDRGVQRGRSPIGGVWPYPEPVARGFSKRPKSAGKLAREHVRPLDTPAAGYSGRRYALRIGSATPSRALARIEGRTACRRGYPQKHPLGRAGSDESFLHDVNNATGPRTFVR